MQVIDKSSLRKKYKKNRSLLSSEIKKNLDLEIGARLLMTKEYRSSSIVLTYVSTREEIDTINIINAALVNNKIVCVPKCIGKEIKFYRINSLKDLSLGKYNILEPNEGLSEFDDYSNSICVTPCLCVDFEGHRVGYGAGYYDRFFNKYNGIKVALSYTNHVQTKILYDDYDVPVDLIVTDSYTRYIK